MSVISVNNLTFAYDGSYDNIFENVSFQIDTDWKLGFIGRNGRGKTTFLNLLQNKHEYKGNISASVIFDCFPFAIQDKSLDTITIIDSICFDYESWMLYKELSILEVDEDVLYRPFYTLSNGEQTKVLLAALFLNQNHFLLLDEPTNHLDVEAREIIGKYLNSKKGFILVSHDRVFLDNCIDHVLSINKTNIEVQKGNFLSWFQNKESQDNFEISQNEKLKKDIKKLTESSKRTSNWSDSLEKTKHSTRIAGLRPDRGFIGHKSAKMMKTSKNLENRKQSAIDQKSKLLKNIESSENLAIHPLKYHSRILISFDNVCISYGSKPVCTNVNFTVNQGDRVAISGKNGCGKTTILKLILENKLDYTGNLNIGSQLKLSYVPQDTSFLNGSLNDFIKQSNVDQSLFKTILRKLDFSRDQFEKNIDNYSEGQKKKVVLAKSLSEQSHLYIWDEPLNFIDVLSRIQIEQLILEYKPTIIFVEHDKMFVQNIANKIINL